jgi:hypothetical protein
MLPDVPRQAAQGTENVQIVCVVRQSFAHVSHPIVTMVLLALPIAQRVYSRAWQKCSMLPIK